MKMKWNNENIEYAKRLVDQGYTRKTVNAVNTTGLRTKEEKIKGKIVKEYDNYYLIDNGNYKQTVLKNSLINGDIKIVSCSR